MIVWRELFCGCVTMKILVSGATGLVGQGVVMACQASAAVERLAVLVRKGGDAPAGVEEIVLTDFLLAHEVVPLLGGFDACFIVPAHRQ